jgi:hypothetical protein
MASSFGFRAAVKASAKNSAFIAGQPSIGHRFPRVAGARLLVLPEVPLICGHASRERVWPADSLNFG